MSNIGNSFSDGSRKTRKQRQDRELQRAKPWGTSRQDGTQSPRGGRDTEAETEMKVRVRPARVGRGQRTEERADVTVRRRARGWRDLQKSPRGESRLNHGRPGPQEGACAGLQRGGPGVLSGVGLRVWLGACNVTAAVRRTHGAARTGTCGLGRESSDSAVLRVCSACHRPKDSAEKGQPERPGKAGPPGLWHGGWRLGRKRSRSQKWADTMPQSQRTAEPTHGTREKPRGRLSGLHCCATQPAERGGSEAALCRVKGSGGALRVVPAQGPKVAAAQRWLLGGALSARGLGLLHVVAQPWPLWVSSQHAGIGAIRSPS